MRRRAAVTITGAVAVLLLFSAAAGYANEHT
jgi:hypothetical protein